VTRGWFGAVGVGRQDAPAALIGRFWAAAQLHRSPMTRFLACLALAILLPVLADAAVESWAFVESVGGLTVADPVQVGGYWLLPVRANVSGLESISRKPTKLNSALACSNVAATVTGASIFLAIVTGVAGPGASARCPAAKLGSPPRGGYTVFYRGPDNIAVRIRTVSIGL
jgi:hypothetical protein